jgi:ArsR family transcriptional regulator
MPTKNLTDKLVFKIKADFLGALSHPTRLEIIEYLRTSESSVGKMVADLGVEQSALSKHLSVLRQAGIVASRHEKATVYYSIRDRHIYQVLRPISEILRKNLEESRAVLDRLARP